MSCPSTSSGLKSADAVISAATSTLRGLTVIADGTNEATVILYDNASAASGTVLDKVIVDAGLTHVYVPYHGGVVALNGIYADVTGTGAAYIVHYSRGD